MNETADMRHDVRVHVPRTDQAIAYLKAAGWRRRDEDSRTSLWFRDDHKDLPVVLPLQGAADGAESFVYEAVRVIAFVEKRLPAEVCSDMIDGGADRVALRLLPDMPSGEAPLGMLVSSFAALQNYVTASAAAHDNRSLVLPPRRDSHADSYARTVPVSVQAGSFIVAVALPLVDPTPPATRSEDGSEQPLFPATQLVEAFGRFVSTRMMLAAEVALSQADEYYNGKGSLSVFASEHPNRPNATELSALADLAGLDASYQLRFTQSPLGRQPRTPVVFDVTQGQQRIFAEAAEFLRVKQPRSDVEFSGRVFRLERDGNSGPGQVVVAAVVDDSGRQRRVHMELGETDYNDALLAHKENLRVVGRGDLAYRGNFTTLQHVRGFAVIHELPYE